MWRDIGVAFALFLIIEGIAPFLSPARLRALMQTLAGLGDAQLRVAGLLSMGFGVLLLYLVNK